VVSGGDRLAVDMTFFRRISRRIKDDVGMTTAEYAVGTIAAVAFAVVLYRVVQSSAVQDALSSIIQSALHVNL